MWWEDAFRGCVSHARDFQLREIELRVQREINEKRQELLAKEESLRCVGVTQG